MGSCVTREFLASAHKEPAAAIAPQESCAPAAAPEQGSEEASGGILPDTCASPGGAPHVTALASSSLGGLVQTIKDHVTKPTAMAHGRVAHLIEWKGWSAPQTGWEPSLTDEECYAELADALKEARFAAGVAEQFAVTEAMLSAWPSLDEIGLTGPGTLQDVTRLQDLGGLYLQENSAVLFAPQAVSSLPLAGSSSSSTPALSPPSLPRGHSAASGWSALGGSMENPLPWRAVGQESAASSLWQPPSRASLRYLGSSSLSEDEVFYN